MKTRFAGLPSAPGQVLRPGSLAVLFSLVLVGLFFASEALHGNPKQVDEWEWEEVQRIVALGDIHGSFETLKSALVETGLTDKHLNWRGGTDHLVLCGDLIDRGPHDRAVLDLLIKLEEQARDAGGRVHAVLGNHDVMNMVRDFRYVSEQSFADFAVDENPKEREEVWSRFKALYAKDGLVGKELRAAFEERYPAGFFSRIDAFDLAGTYGSWLIKKPAVLKINGNLFVHGGLTPEVAQLGINQINQDFTRSFRDFLDAAEAISQDMKLPARFRDYYSKARSLEDKAMKQGPSSVPTSQLMAARTLLAQLDKIPFSPNGPLWYRGNSLENERGERDRVSRALQLLDARKLVVGHTITRQRIPTTRFNRRVIRADVGMAYGGNAYAILFEGDSVNAFDLADTRSRPLMVEAPQGQGWALSYEHLSDPQLESILTNGNVVDRRAITRGSQAGEIWELKLNETTLRAVFKDVNTSIGGERRNYQNEVAAYLFDRKIGIDMVPPTVIRSVDEKEGALRVLVESAVDLVSIRSYHGLEGKEREETIAGVSKRYGMDLDEVRQQVYRARLFDALIGKRIREDEDKLLMPAEGRILLVDHEEAFPEDSSIDFMVPVACEVLHGDLELSLADLNAEELVIGIGSYLSRKQIEALLERRDRIVEQCRGSIATANDAEFE